MSDIFTKMMEACLESRQTPTANVAGKKPVVKKVTESKKVGVAPVKKAPVAGKVTIPANKRVAEAKRVMEDEFDAEMNELDAYEAGAEDENVVDDIVDDIVVVVDPELDEEEITQTAEDAQEIIDNTAEGEIPSTDEYIGDLTYTCPVCGNTFFSSEEMVAGDECPVCGETPDDFVLVGEVQEADAEDEGEDEVTDVAEVPAEDADEELIVDVDEAEMEECVQKETLSLDESTFNPYLTKFIRENYKNAKSFTVVGASLNRKSGRLTLECKLAFKSGKTKKVVLKAEGYKAGRSILSVKDDGTFKVESKNVAPIALKVSTVKDVIRCEGMKYDFVTVVEGRRARVTSAPLVESTAKKRPAVKPVVRRK